MNFFDDIVDFSLAVTADSDDPDCIFDWIKRIVFEIALNRVAVFFGSFFNTDSNGKIILIL